MQTLFWPATVPVHVWSWGIWTFNGCEGDVSCVVWVEEWQLAYVIGILTSLVAAFVATVNVLRHLYRLPVGACAG